MTPFRVLIVDDTIADTLVSAGDNIGEKIEQATSDTALWVLKELTHVQRNSSPVFDIYFAGNLRFDKKSVKATPDTKNAWKPEYLESLNALVLDFGGVSLRSDWYLKQDDENVADASSSELELLNGTYPGAAFYLKKREMLKNCQLILFLTRHDVGTSSGAESNPVIKKYVSKWCDGKTKPQTLMFPPDEDGFTNVVNRIKAIYARVSRGYTKPKSLDAIDFAATHDEPVLIVGETGTGKEDTALAIHDRWLQEKKRLGIDVPHKQLSVVNCAGLTPFLARSELFGHVRGSFTGADDHRIGAILTACGCEGFRSNKKGINYDDIKDKARKYKKLVLDVKDYNAALSDKEKLDFLVRLLNTLNDEILRDKYKNSAFDYLSDLHRKLSQIADGSDYVGEFEHGLTVKNKEIIQPDKSGVKFINKGPFGTLFLDEFGELPPEVQTLLLRYLQGKEVQPFGYPYQIKGANVRIIAATSDPRVASFVGVQLYGGWRSAAELEKPLREDLIFRIKGQVIRAESITVHNVEETLDHFISQSKDPLKWTKGARSHLLKKLIKQLSAIESAVQLGNTNGKDLPAFGHHRELSNIIKLADTYVAHAKARGLRSSEDDITEEIIDLIWEPSVVRSYSVFSPDNDLNSQDSKKVSPAGQSEVVDGVLDTVKEFFKKNGNTLSSNWREKRPQARGKEIQQRIKDMVQNRQAGAINRLREAIEKSVEGISGKVLDEVYIAVFGWARGTVRPWFSRPLQKKK
jgi:Sigma-54 interaction domain